MRSVIISSVILLIILAFTVVNTVLLDNICEKLLEEVNSYDAEALDGEALSLIYGNFKQREGYINLTVNHTMTSAVHEAFAELEGAVAAGNAESAMVAKSRLSYAVRRLWQMEKLSLKSIV